LRNGDQRDYDIPDNDSQDLIDKAECIIVYPSVLKAAFVVGGSYGRGAMVCRSGEHFTGPWSAPTMMALEGASFGLSTGRTGNRFRVGHEPAARSILPVRSNSEADSLAAAGPKGRDAEASTDVTMRAEILTYSRARGLLCGYFSGRFNGPSG
jgi:lipid-binding SYLF domain-containing protein